MQLFKKFGLVSYISFGLGIVIGSLTCYIAYSYTYFNAEVVVAIISLLVSIASAIITYYLATKIQKSLLNSQKKQQIYLYKFDKIIQISEPFFDELGRNTIAHSVLVYNTNKIEIEITKLLNVFNLVGVENEKIVDAQNAIVAIDDFFSNSQNITPNNLNGISTYSLLATRGQLNQLILNAEAALIELNFQIIEL